MSHMEVIEVDGGHIKRRTVRLHAQVPESCV